MYNILIGGAAGDGVETTASLLEQTLKRCGVHVFGIRDVMSRIRGGHNFAQIRFGPEPVGTHRDGLDGIVALNRETWELHRDRLSPGGFIILDALRKIDDSRVIPADLSAMAKQAGNGMAVGSVAVGMLLKHFSLNIQVAEQVFRESLPANHIQANLQALHAGFTSASPMTGRPLRTAVLDDAVLSTGGKLMALGALAAGMRFYAAYPMSPATSILTYLTEHIGDIDVVVEQAEDEIAAVNMALGASAAGVRAMTGTSGGGFSLMVEALGFAGIAELPIVVADVQRPGPATGLPTRTEQGDLRFVISASQGEFPRMVLSARDHAHVYTQTVRAFALAERYQVPVILLSDQHLADSAATLPLSALLEGLYAEEQEEASPESGMEYRRYRLTNSGISPRRFPGKSNHIVRVDSDEHDEYGVITEAADMRRKMVDKRQRKAALLEREAQEPLFVGDVDFGTLLVGFGSTYGAITDAVQRLNDRGGFVYGALCFGDVFPLPTGRLTKYARQAKRVVNVEQNATGQLASLIRETTGITCQHSILKYDGRPLSSDNLFTSLMSLEEVAANE